MPDLSPLTDLLRRVETLRAAVAVERAELARLGLPQLAALDVERLALEAAWHRVRTRASAAAATGRGWAEGHLHGDIARLSGAQAQGHERRVARAEALRELERDLRRTATPGDASAEVLPLRPAQ